MKKKILAWIDADLSHFGILKSLEEKTQFTLSFIYDITNTPKTFFKSQKIIPLENSWFLYDNLNYNSQKIDMEYLESFEKKYSINLWTLLNNDRYLNNFNDFYHFSSCQILFITEQQIKFYEKILDEYNPDYVVMANPPLNANYLFSIICRSRNIPTLILTPSRFLNKYYIDDGNVKLDLTQTGNSDDGIDLNSYHQKFNKTFETKNFLKKFQSSKISLLKAFFVYIFSDNNNLKTHYTYFGRNKINVLSNFLANSWKSKTRKNFIDKNLKMDVILDQKYIYFPLHMEPERTLLIDAPFHTNQLDIIKNLAKSIPINYKLFVKEHPSMAHREWRDVSFYKEILSLPNVVLIHPSFPSDDLIKQSSLVIAITGTASFDAIFYNIPSITLTKTDFSSLDFVTHCDSWDKLPNLIKKSLIQKIDKKMLSPYLHFIEQHCFDFEMYPFLQEHQDFLHYGGFLVNTKIIEKDFKLFLESKKSQYDFLAQKYIEKIILD